MTRTERIRTWMSHVIDTHRFDAFDDLHVDTIDPGFAPRDTWISAVTEVLETSKQIRKSEGWNVTVAVGMSLTSHPRPVGLQVSDIGDLAGQIDLSPPSLYLFKPGEEPWTLEKGFVDWTDRLAANRPSWTSAHFLEWFDQNDQDYRRSFWLAA